MEALKVSGHDYVVARRMPAMTQFHVTRRLGPALVVCGVTFKMMLDGVAVSLDDWAAVAGPVLDVVSHMSDDDVEYVINACLRCVDRRNENGTASPLVAPGTDATLMFQDVDMAVMLRLTVEVLRENLANFARGLTADGSSSGGSVAVSP